MLKKLFLSLFLSVSVLAPVTLSAQRASGKLPDWQNPEVVQRHRLPMTATFETDQQQTLSLNGTWNFKFNPKFESRTVGFEDVHYDDSFWKTIPVPGLWEMEGWCDPIYVNVGYPWRGHARNTPPLVPTNHNYVGQYRRTFELDDSWVDKSRKVYLCIGSATSNVRVWINGKEVGYSEDSKLEARFDITRYVKTGQNLIALEVHRWCDGTYLEDQDFWRLGGIARGVYLYTREKNRIEDINVNADMYGNLSIRSRLTGGIKTMDYQVLDPQGKEVAHFAKAVDGKKQKAEEGGFYLDAFQMIQHPALWSAESPSLYTLIAIAKNSAGATAESVRLRFGFRSVAVEGGQLLVNGQPILLKGVNRHELNAYKGYVVSTEDMLRDIKIMKELNINAVRTCHYPDDPRWLQLCDEWGLYVIDEGNIESHGMGYEPDQTLANDPQYHLAHMERDQRMVYRDINHPSVIIWSLGNEAGNGTNFKDAYDWVKFHDPSRPVQYCEARNDRNTDIYCPMYRSLEECEKYLASKPSRPLIQCEYAHAMGNSMGNFKEYWDLIRKHPSYQGGFIWDFVDQALVKEVSPEKYGTDHVFAFGGDYNDYDVSDGSFNCNGLIAADRSLHPHAMEVRYQHRNILTRLPSDVAAVLGMALAVDRPVAPYTAAVSSGSSVGAGTEDIAVEVYNEHFFTDLSNYRMIWKVMAAGKTVLSGVVNELIVGPQQTERVSLGVEAKEIARAVAAERSRIARRYAALGRNASADEDVFLQVSYELKAADGLLEAGTEVAYDQLNVKEGAVRAFENGSAAVKDGGIEMTYLDFKVIFRGSFTYAGTAGERVADWSMTFDKQKGALVNYSIDGERYLEEALLPNFNRAPTENDLGAGLDFRLKPWRSHEFKVEDFKVRQVGEEYYVDVRYEPVMDFGYVTMKYVIYKDGSLRVKESLHDAGHLSAAPDLFRFGMAFTMPGYCSALDFYGYGPEENYVDRHSSQLMGHYQQRVEDQYHYGYVRTQESGTKTGLRWFKITDANGTGLEVTADTRFSASALPFSVLDRDVALIDPRPRPNPTNNQAGEALHSLEIREKAHELARSKGKTYVCFDLIQQGLGGTNSWGRLPLEQYRVPPQEYEFDFVIRPVNN